MMACGTAERRRAHFTASKPKMRAARFRGFKFDVYQVFYKKLHAFPSSVVIGMRRVSAVSHNHPNHHHYRHKAMPTPRRHGPGATSGVFGSRSNSENKETLIGIHGLIVSAEMAAQRSMCASKSFRVLKHLPQPGPGHLYGQDTEPESSDSRPP